MASARLLDTYSSAGASTGIDTLSSTGQYDPSDHDPSQSIDFKSLGVILAVSGIAIGMVGVMAFFCIRNKHSNAMQQTEFKVVMRKRLANAEWESLFIPQLGVERTLTHVELAQIETIGLMPFLKHLVRELVEDRVRNGEALASELAIEQVMSVFMPKADASNDLPPHDMPLSVIARYNPRNNRCNFFATILQPLTQATLFFEIGFGTVMSISSLQLYPGILPVSRAVNNDIALAQALLSSVFMLFMMYIGAAQAFMGDLGSTVDRFFISSYDKLKSRCFGAEVVAPQIIPVGEPDSFSLKCKIRLSQFVLALFVLNNLLTEVEGDYQQTISLNQRIEALDDSLIPVWIVYLCSMIEFGLNQLNDPIMLISEVYMGMTLIDMYFHRNAARASSVVISEVDEEIGQLPVSNAATVLRASASLPMAGRHGLQRIGQFSHRLNEEKYAGLSASKSLNAPLLAPKTP